MDVLKSQSDDRKYRNIVLPNKMQVLLISDKKNKSKISSMAAASMTVNVGSYYDPKSHLGLAHFLEHMLFMGTKKYEGEDHFMNFLNKYGGSTNAFTADEATTYFFDIQSKQFNEAIDIFAQFFISPLFSPDSVGRELMAVEAEHSKNLNSDMWRLDRVVREISRKEHPFHKFSTGNLETLKSKDIREQLIKFYEKYYSANLMKLVVLTNMSLDQMEKMVKEKFSAVKNKDVKRMIYDGQPFAKQSAKQSTKKNGKKIVCHNLIEAVPIQDENTLTIIWQLPNLQEHYQFKPFEVLAYYLGHESDGSISYFLKNYGLIDDLQVGKFGEDISTTLISINISLTLKGLKNTTSVVDTIYKYINRIRNVMTDRANVVTYNELKIIDQNTFDYLVNVEPQEYVSDLSMNMLKYDIRYIIYGPYYHANISDAPKNDEYKKIINDTLGYLKRDNSIIVIGSKAFEGKTSKIEKWYGIKYNHYVDPITMLNMNDSVVNEDVNMNYDWLNLPTKNLYIPSSINVYEKNVDSKKKYPSLLKNDDNLRIWFKQDNEFMKPKIMYLLQIYSPDIYATVDNYVTIQLLIRIINDMLESDTYYALVAGSIYGLTLTTEYINIFTDAYNEISPKLLDTVLGKLFDINKDRLLTQETFDRNLNEYKKDLHNYIYGPLFKLSNEYFREKTYYSHYTFKERLEALDNVTFRSVVDIDNIKNILFERCYAESLLQGNVKSEDTKKIIEILKTYNMNKLSKDKLPRTTIKVDALENGEEEIYMLKNYNQSENDSIINTFFEIGQIKEGLTKDWDTTIFKLGLITMITQEKFFNQLRSKEQSGYIVKSLINKLGSPNRSKDKDNRDNIGYVYGLSYIIQSPKKDPIMLRKRIKNFIVKMGDYINEMTDDEFNEYVKVFVINLKKDDVNLYEEFGRNSECITNKTYMFGMEEHLASVSSKITKDAFYKFYDQHFLNKDSRKIRIVEMYSSAHL